MPDQTPEMALRTVASPPALPRVLVVDDDPISRNLQGRMLALLGYAAVETDDAEHALTLARSGAVNAMLLDLGMPEVDGFALLRALRDDEARADRAPLPVIAVTGYCADADRLRCLVAGFQEHLAKPVDAPALGALLQRLLAAARMVPDDSDAQRVQATAQRLARMKPADAAFAPNMLETFAMRSGQLVEDVIAHTTARDAVAVAQATAALAASAEFMGARHLAEVTHQLARAAAGGDWDTAATTAAHLPAVHEAVLVILLGAHRRMAA
jgi:two-component system sensor histidine kinase EvgS